MARRRVLTPVHCPLPLRLRSRATKLLPALLGAFLLLVAPFASAKDEPEGFPDPHDDLPDWLPSVGIGGAILTRDTQSSIDGQLTTPAGNPAGLNRGISITSPCVDNPQQGGTSSLCTYASTRSVANDGFVMPVSAQLLGPAWKRAWLKPRPLLQGGYAFGFEDRALVTDGFLPADFDSNGTEPDLGLRLIVEQQNAWWAGGGVALQLPFESYPTWIKLSVNYMEEENLVTALIDQNFTGANPPTLISSMAEEVLKTRSIAPAIGLEAIVGTLGPLGISFSADVLIPIALDGTRSSLAVVQPGGESTAPWPVPTQFLYDADDVGFLGSVMVRFVWMGMKR